MSTTHIKSLTTLKLQTLTTTSFRKNGYKYKMIEPEICVTTDILAFIIKHYRLSMLVLNKNV